MDEKELRINIKRAQVIEEKANCPADKIIANYLKNKLIAMFIKKKFPKPVEL